MTLPVHFQLEGDIAVITVNNPPVNALSADVRKGIWNALEQLDGSGSKAVVLHCEGKTFFAGADIREFGTPPADPWLPKLLDRLEACEKPVIAAMHGTVLGGGLETAMASHYRIARPDTKLGLPEVTLGILPGAGGTQRLPRLVGMATAFEMIINGKMVSASKAMQTGLVDRLAEGDVLQAALDWAREMLSAGTGVRRTSTLSVRTDSIPAGFFEQCRETVQRRHHGLPAQTAIVECLEAACQADYNSGVKLERQKFQALVNTTESKALRHMFFADRQVARVEGLAPGTSPRVIQSVGIVGAGTMGGGIAMSFATSGFQVTLLDLNQEALDRGLSVCRSNYERSAARGRFTTEQVEQFMGRIGGSTSYADLAGADLVIEAVFEDPEIKKAVFRQLDAVCKSGAILATNTSYQDIDEIAQETGRPQDVIGMHFFSPANIMKLLEVVRGEETADGVVLTAMQLARSIGKVPVLSGVCYGFIGNRMLKGYFRESQMLLLEGATPSQIDQAMVDFGMAMGPIAVLDLAGLDIGYQARKAIPDLPDHPAYHVNNQLVEMNRLGQKTGAGFYRYGATSRSQEEDPAVTALIKDEAERLGIIARPISDEHIVERLIYPLINEGARILEEGIAQRSSDIDVVYRYGYGFPAYRGGPMFYADTVGASKIYAGICNFRDQLGRSADWQPAPMLERLAKSSGRFSG